MAHPIYTYIWQCLIQWVRSFLTVNQVKNTCDNIILMPSSENISQKLLWIQLISQRNISYSNFTWLECEFYYVFLAKLVPKSKIRIKYLKKQNMSGQRSQKYTGLFNEQASTLKKQAKNSREVFTAGLKKTI